MSRYIDADKLKQHYAWIRYADNETADLFDNIIDQQPSADVVPLKDYQSMERTCKKLQDRLADVRENVRGEWIRRKDKPLQNWYQCSICGAICGDMPRYCSECGADMRGDNNVQRNNS